jgi:methanogenic corrinoid protein MtbC1
VITTNNLDAHYVKKPQVERVLFFTGFYPVNLGSNSSASGFLL